MAHNQKNIPHIGHDLADSSVNAEAIAAVLDCSRNNIGRETTEDTEAAGTTKR